MLPPYIMKENHFIIPVALIQITTQKLADQNNIYEIILSFINRNKNTHQGSPEALKNNFEILTINSKI